MKSAEARFGEAITELTRILESHGIEDGRAIAHDFVHGLVREGWRAVGRPVEEPQRPQLRVVADPEAKATLLDEARARIAAAREGFTPKEAPRADD